VDGERTSSSFSSSDISAPGRFKRLSSRIDSLVYVLGRSGVEVEQVFAGGWVDGGERLPVRRGDEFVVAEGLTSWSAKLLKRLKHHQSFRPLT